MHPDYDYIEAMRNQLEKHKYLLAHGEVTFWNEYSGGPHTVVVKFITCDNEKYYVVENYIGAVVELRKLEDIT